MDKYRICKNTTNNRVKAEFFTFGSNPLNLLLKMLFIVVGLMLISLSAGAEEPGAVVKLTDQLTFTPKNVTVNVGDMVRWNNKSQLVHTVTADPELAAKGESIALPRVAKPFNSGNLSPDETFKQKFTVPGTYRYFCIPHEGAGMIGEVIVRPAN